ncbi:hypothetical protein BB427_03185 [Pseudoalteromonas sp. BMB]|uniref:VWA domain-containing protein n=1 Tax=Pseudoalteromonas sp. BMB TaxID=1874619 RepID=UPI00083E1A45|nr:VWA domain-containing protein [Pseudoalteromonas sp. BMB]ODB35619.1 hypothetical protein BB427_03185 [Pseudoalteromonas sp. BMB]
MKKSRAPIEVFNLAFLDIISCAFGAVVMLILLAKNGEEGEHNDASQVSELIQAITKAEAQVSELQGALSDKELQLMQAKANSASNAEQAEALQASIARAQNNVQKLTDAASGLEDVREQQKRAAIQANEVKERDEEVGGIPVDSEYVIFIVDTSGSMKRIWNKVMSTMNEVLNNHPEVKGFQVMSDNGEYLISSSKGSWRKDGQRQRASILDAMRKWHGSSSSSPAEGIEEALSRYGQKTDSLALYVFGDEFSGGSYDSTLEKLNKLNTNKRTGEKIARIHAIGFNSGYSFEKFATLMTAVARDNNGTFMTVN